MTAGTAACKASGRLLKGPRSRSNWVVYVRSSRSLQEKVLRRRMKKDRQKRPRIGSASDKALVG